ASGTGGASAVAGSGGVAGHGGAGGGGGAGPGGARGVGGARVACTELPATTVKHPIWIAVGPDGNFWVTEYNVGQIARVTPAGGVTQIPHTARHHTPLGSTAS